MIRSATFARRRLIAPHSTRQTLDASLRFSRIFKVKGGVAEVEDNIFKQCARADAGRVVHFRLRTTVDACVKIIIFTRELWYRL